ncbi:hypothetical protein [Altericista sp. CCNU0014]|uniref:hypothetical protein n=1 Tax=Altericista sp. CCNU0014 TaxID=3082949 RepID=UPI0038509031
MKQQVKLLSLTVWVTVWLLLLGATLVVLGVFNQQLKWDIFSPQVEAFLYGVFFSSLMLSIFGVAIAFVLSLKRIVEAVEALERKGSLDPALAVPKTRPLTYVGYMLGLFAAFAALIGVLGLVDYQVQVHRSEVFKRIAAEQMQRFGQRLIPPLSQFQKTPVSASAKPKLLQEVMNAFRELPFVRQAMLYVPDSRDGSVLWRYTSYPQVSKDDAPFQRFLVVKQFEEAIQQSLKGNSKALEDLNRQSKLEWYHTIKDDRGKPLGVLKIEGNPSENFREYRLGSSAIP